MRTGNSSIDGLTSPYGTTATDLRTKLLTGINQRIRAEMSPVTANTGSLNIMRHAPAKRPFNPSITSAAYDPSYVQAIIQQRGYGGLGGNPMDSLGMPNLYSGYCGGGEVKRFDDGGPVDDQQMFDDGGMVEEAMPYLAGAAALGLGRAAPRAVNAIARPLMRAMAKPVMGIEATSKVPLSLEQALHRFNIARDESMSPHASRPFQVGQGAWEGENGMEHNPLMMQSMPRTMRDLINRPDYMQYLAQMGSNLDQEGAPISRFVPNLINTPKSANALMAHGVDSEALKAIAGKLGSGYAVAHRPGNKALVFSLGDEPNWEDLAGQIRPMSSGVKFGRSDPLKDRVILSKTPWGDATYGDMGAMERSPVYRKYEDNLMGGALNYLQDAP